MLFRSSMPACIMNTADRIVVLSPGLRTRTDGQFGPKLLISKINLSLIRRNRLRAAVPAGFEGTNGQEWKRVSCLLIRPGQSAIAAGEDFAPVIDHEKMVRIERADCNR